MPYQDILDEVVHDVPDDKFVNHLVTSQDHATLCKIMPWLSLLFFFQTLIFIYVGQS